MFTADIATVSARGQVAIPADVRKALDIKEGDKVLFITQDGAVTVKKVGLETFLKNTETFLKMKKKVNENDVVDIVHGIRKNRS